MICVEVHEDSNHPVYYKCCKYPAEVEALRAKLLANEDYGYGFIAEVIQNCDCKRCPKEEYHEYNCNYCDDRGCVNCEPHRFIR